MSNKAEHTPGPWIATTDFASGVFWIEIPDEELVLAEVYGGDSDERLGSGQCEANAEFIVRACNAHDDLLAALEGLLSELPELWGDDLRDGAMDLIVGEDDILRALDAIDRAKGQRA